MPVKDKLLFLNIVFTLQLIAGEARRSSAKIRLIGGKEMAKKITLDSYCYKNRDPKFLRLRQHEYLNAL